MVDADPIPTRKPPLTPKFIESLKPRDKLYEVPDGGAPGLRLRVYPSGARSWRWGVRVRERVIVLGPWAMAPTPGHLTLQEARGWLERLKVAHKGGPAELAHVEGLLKAHLKPPRQAPALGGKTVNDVAKDFMRVLRTQRKRPKEAEDVLERDILPFIGGMPLAGLNKSDCKDVVARVVGRGATVYAGKVLGLLKQMLAFAANTEDFTSPITELKASFLGVENNVRQRKLNENELALFWTALDPDPPGAETGRSIPEETTRLALRLLLLTAARSGELRLAAWANVDLEEALWVIPVSDQKLSPKQAAKARPFVIALPPTAVAIFQRLKQLAGESPWVLASEISSDGRYHDKALGKAMQRLWRSHPALRKLPAATPHDLRRTARSAAALLGTAPHVGGRLLNHQIGGRVQQTYEVYDYLPERREALLKLDAYIQRLVNPEASNVAFLPAAGA